MIKNIWFWSFVGLIVVLSVIKFGPTGLGTVLQGKKTISWKISVDPWTVKSDGYTYDANGSLILDDNGMPMKGVIAL